MEYNSGHSINYVYYGIWRRRKGTICVNGAAAHRANPGDRVILATFAEIDSEKADNWEPHIVIMNEDNTQKE